jgi:hypothetical protein
MQSDSTIQNLWVRLLGEVRQPGATRIQKVEDGYYLVARAVGENGDANSTPTSGDYSALESRIPNLCRTRAVYLNLGNTYHLREGENPREWLGEAAERLEAGVLHAFAVVDTEIFSRRIAWELLARGWTVEETGQDLQVHDGRFKAALNLLRAIVRMVLSRSNMAEAARSVIGELIWEFSRHASFFARFQKRFETFQPDVLDHYLVAYPDATCVALAWDYWRAAGRSPGEAEQVFNEGVAEFERLLQSPVGTWLPEVSLGVCPLGSFQN